MAHAIEVQELSKRFGDLTAVDGLSLSVEAGEVLGLLGHNGAGKTTTVRLLNGVLSPDGGSTRTLGLDPAADGPALRRRTGVLTETPALDERLSARENLSIYADLYGVRQEEIASRVDRFLADFGLAERASERVGGYSKGMKQRLALARALLHEPELLFLDEPTAGLDPAAARDVHALIERLSGQGRSVILCTHNLDEAQRLCDRVAVLERGRLLALGTPHELASRLGSAARLEIETALEHAERARALLQAAGLEATDAGGGALGAAGVARARVPDLIEALVAGGVPLYRCGLREPSLEDVYFALHDSQGEKT